MSTAVVAICAAGALASTLYTGRRNPSVILIGLFVIWVLAPFAVLTLRSRRGDATFAMTIAILLLAAFVYAAFGPPVMHGAFLYLLIPALAWLTIAGRVLARRT